MTDEVRRFGTSAAQLRKHLQDVELWVKSWLEKIERGGLDAVEADTIRMAALLYRRGLEKDLGIIFSVDEIIEAYKMGEQVPSDLLSVAQQMERAVQGPEGLQAIPDLALKASRPSKDTEEDAKRRESVVSLATYKAAS